MSKDHAAFVASATHPSLGTEVATGSVTFDLRLLRFTSPQILLEIPLAQLDIEVDSEDERVQFSSPDLPGCSVWTDDQSILNHPALRLQTHTRNQLRAIRGANEFQRRIKITLAVLGGFVLVAFLVSMLLGVMVRVLVARVPAEWEQKLGDKLFEEIQEEGTIITNAQIEARLDKAVAPLLAALPKSEIPYKFYLMQEPLPNAFALPGGYVFVTTSLLDLAEQPEEVAGVVAHEIAHVTLKHGFRKLISSAGPYLIFKLFFQNSNGLLGAIGNGSELIVRQGFSQEYELEADDAGWQYLVQARVDPRGLTGMLRKLEAEQRRLLGGSHGMVPGAFSSHPATQKRIARLEAKWKKLADKSAFRSSTP